MASVSAVQNEIENRLRLHAEALVRSDVDAALELFAPDAIVRPANVPPLRGVSALREFFERTFAAMAFAEGKFFTEELYLYDSLAFHYGTYEFSTSHFEGTRIRDKGAFSIVWRRGRDGRWRYHRGMMNSSLPAGGRAGAMD